MPLRALAWVFLALDQRLGGQRLLIRIEEIETR